MRITTKKAELYEGKVNERMNRIELRVDGEGWVAEHIGDCAVEVIRLFDTDTLPTPFLKNTRASLVVDAIERLNPGCEVIVKG